MLAYLSLVLLGLTGSAWALRLVYRISTPRITAYTALAAAVVAGLILTTAPAVWPS